jgi:hypothetical protein
MTTAQTIEHYRQKTIAKMVKRLESAGFWVYDFCKDELFGIHGRGNLSDSGAIIAPSGSTAWTIPQLLALLDLIATHGRSTNYRVRFRSQYRTWSATLIVQAGKIPLEEASRFAEMCSAELLECVRME